MLRLLTSVDLEDIQIIHLNFGAMVDDSTDSSKTKLRDCFILIQENIPTFPIEFNAMYIVAADAANFECDVYMWIWILLFKKDTNVEFTIA